MSFSSNQVAIIMGAQLVFAVTLGIMSAYTLGRTATKVYGISALLMLLGFVVFYWVVIDSCGNQPASERCVIW